MAEKIQFTKKTLIELPPAPAGKRAYYIDVSNARHRLQVTDKGSKSFQVYCWGDGKPQRVTLGRFDPPNGITIEQARKKAAKAIAQITGGREPSAGKCTARQADTVGKLADEYIERHAKLKKKSWREDRRLLEHDIIPAWGNKKAKEVTRHDVIKVLDKIVDRGSPVTANRTLAVIRKMYNFGLQRGIVDTSPCVGVTAPGKETRRDRVLSEDELRSFWSNLDSAKMDERTRLVLKFILVTCQRPGECRQAEWAEIEDGWWTIPSEKAKNKLAQRVPLSSQAMEILESARILNDGRRFVFGSSAGDQPMTIEALSRAVGRNLDVLGADKFTPHDLRRTAASYAASDGVSRVALGKILNHAEPGVTTVYDRHSYDSDKHVALDRWGRRLTQIVTGKKAKVVKLRA